MTGVAVDATTVDVEPEPRPVARIEPSGLEIPVASGETLMGAARREGYAWPSVCGGRAHCTVCYVRIVQGLASVPPASSAERSALRRARGVDPDTRPDTRLACQLTLHGDIVVRKTGVRPGTTARADAL